MSVEHVDVVIVGAGLSGIGAGHHLQTECPDRTYAIFESRSSIGGTWDLFRYPGVRSDSDMFTLGYSFRPWSEDRSIVDGPSILQYIKDTAAEEGIDQHIRFNHRIVRADWSSDEARWTVTAERTDTGDPVTVTCDFLFSCSGYYRYDQGYLPDFPGQERFQGTIVHPQHWPEDLDHTGQRVVVIGSGATAVTLVPSMAETAAHVTMLQRTPTYIVSLPNADPLTKVLHKLPERYAHSAVRWTKVLMTLGSFLASRRWPEQAKKVIRRNVTRQLPEGYDVDTHFTPPYDPWDQRLCVVPDGDLFTAIRAGRASIVTDHIDTFTETGIRLQSGEELEADIIVTATGLDLIALGGLQLSVDGTDLDLPSTLVYKGMMLEGVPNYAFALGYTNASWTLKADLTAQYVCKLLAHLRATGMRQCTPVNDDPTVVEQPLMAFTSGYVTRSMDKFPKQGSKAPWQVSMNYLKDYRALRLHPITDGVMRFSNPARQPATSTAAPEPAA